MSGNTIVTSTLANAVFTNGATISGEWTDTFNSVGILLGVSDASITVTENVFGSTITGTFTNFDVKYGTSDAVNNVGTFLTGLNYEIASTDSSDAFFTGIYLNTQYGNPTPTSLTTNAVGNGFEYSSLHQQTSPSIYSLSSGGVINNTILCFCPGTHIATPAGEIAVEKLNAGDLVITASGEAKPVRWLGRSEVSARFAPRLKSAPIRIAAGALGEGVPARDLRVSPAHALFVGGILIHAGALVNGSSILRETIAEDFSYYHVELESHELLLSEGAATESFVDNVDRMNFTNWAERAGPKTPIKEMDLPRAKSARQVPAFVRELIAARAELIAVQPQVA